MNEKVVNPRGSVGTGIFDQVEQLTANGMSKLAAFKQISAATGRAIGTVAANYYRIARKKGAPLRARRSSAPLEGARRAPGRPPGRPAGSTSSRSVAAALEALISAVKAQEEELARLRTENARFTEIRRLLR